VADDLNAPLVAGVKLDEVVSPGFAVYLPHNGDGGRSLSDTGRPENRRCGRFLVFT